MGLQQKIHNKYGYLFLIPAIVILGSFYIYPMLKTIFLGFTSWDLLSPPIFNGLKNFVKLVEDKAFHRSFFVTIYYVFGSTFLTVPIAFLFALGLNNQTRFQNFFKAIYFIPVVLSTVIASVLWISIYHPYSGIMILFKPPFGLSVQNWYQSPLLVIPGLIIFTLWKGLGLYIIIFFAALQNVPESHLEAAELDGVNAFQKLWYIIIPILKPIILFALVICIVYGFQNFAIVYTSTKGGPKDFSRILPIMIYESGFKYFKMGYASSLAVVMFLLMSFFSYIQFRLFKTRADRA